MRPPRTTACLALAALLCVSAAASRADTYRQIPIIINILSNSGASVANCTNAITLVNEYFRSNNWNVRLKVERVRTDVTNMGDNGNANLTTAEGDAVVARGLHELTNSLGSKGIKITFAKTPWVGHTTPGWSVHRLRSFVARDRITNALTAETLFHEIGHILTLCSNYVVYGTNRADDAGHAPETNGVPWGSDNFMAPSNYRRGTTATTNQIDKITRDGVLDGLSRSVTNRPPHGVGARREDMFARYISPRVTSNAFVFRDVMMWSVRGCPDVLFHVLLQGLFPFGSPTQAWFCFLLDTDNNKATGIRFGPFVGIDRLIKVWLIWEIVQGYALGDVIAIGYDGVQTNALPHDPVVTTSIRVEDTDTYIDAAHGFTFSVPKNMLMCAATNVPVGLIASNMTGVVDTGQMTYYRQFWKMVPDFELYQASAEPGESVPFVIAGLAPGTPCKISFEDSLVLTDTLLPDGTVTGTFTVPSVPLEQTYYVTAQDSSGEFAFNVLTVVPEAGALAALLGIAVLFRSHAPPKL